MCVVRHLVSWTVGACLASDDGDPLFQLRTEARFYTAYNEMESELDLVLVGDFLALVEERHFGGASERHGEQSFVDGLLDLSSCLQDSIVTPVPGPWWSDRVTCSRGRTGWVTRRA